MRKINQGRNRLSVFLEALFGGRKSPLVRRDLAAIHKDVEEVAAGERRDQHSLSGGIAALAECIGVERRMDLNDAGTPKVFGCRKTLCSQVAADKLRQRQPLPNQMPACSFSDAGLLSLLTAAGHPLTFGMRPWQGLGKATSSRASSSSQIRLLTRHLASAPLVPAATGVIILGIYPSESHVIDWETERHL